MVAPIVLPAVDLEWQVVDEEDEDLEAQWQAVVIALPDIEH